MTHRLTRILTTLPDTATATILGKALVTARLVACAHITPPGLSIYTWNGTPEDSPEVQLWLKTTPERTAAVLAEIARLHPYDCPMILTDQVEANQAYAEWVTDQTR
ncbi:divalent-cation tolerance protein CutA [Rhodobacter capsulatus]|uniref:divalent-cation tolerance protein CutA n=1 Tax=Rhodobacter capsulatus TaxID=1061 RepID=UPI00402A4511